MATPLVGTFRPPTVSRSDAVAVCLVLLLVPLVVGRPYARVGADVADGRAYRAYFTADFVWKMAVVAEVSKGDMPPRNQFLRGTPLHYYWTPHLLSALEYRTLGRDARLDRLLLVNATLLGLVFMTFLYAFARQFTVTPAAAAAGCVFVLLFSSYEGLERLIHVWREGLPIAVLRNVNIYAVTRWFYGALPVDGLHRLLLYQPQHHAMAYAVGLSTLLLAVQAQRLARPAVLLLVGTLLGASVLLSAFSAIMAAGMTAVYVLVRLLAAGQWRALLPCALAGAVPLAAAAAAGIGLQYVDRSAGAEGLVEIIVNPMAVRQPLITVPLSFGAVLFVGVAGLVAGLRRVPSLFIAPLVVVVLSALFFCFVNVRDHQYVYVGWRAGHYIFIASAALCGFALERLWAGRARLATLGVVAVLALAALPSVLLDLYNTQDIDNRSPGPGFNWTTILTHDELEALDWLRRLTPVDSVVQVEPHVRQNYTWAYLPAFAERRMAAGLPISMVPLKPYEEASARVREVYTASNAQHAYELAARLRIDYLVIGPPEAAAYPDLRTRLDERPELFRQVFRNGTMTIYFVDGGARQPLG